MIEDAYFWFIANDKRFRTCQDFERLFVKYFIGDVDEDAMDEIYCRKQGKDEKVTHFLADLENMMLNLSVPLSI